MTLASNRVGIGLTSDQEAIRDGVAELCREFPGEYWRELERDSAYPEEFVAALTEGGWLAALIPEEYGGVGLGITEAARDPRGDQPPGGNSGACHAQMYIMGTLLRHGTEEQKQRYLPEIAAGELRLQAFGVTEPNAGSDTTRIRTRAPCADGDWYVVNGQKIWISRVRALRPDAAARAHHAVRRGRDSARAACRCSWSTCASAGQRRSTIRPIATMMNHATDRGVLRRPRAPGRDA